MCPRSDSRRLLIITAILTVTSSIAAAQVPEAPPPVTDRATLHRWLLQLKSGDPRDVDDAARAFSWIQPGEDRETIELLSLGLNDPNPCARRFSAGCFVKLGRAGRAAIPALERLLADTSLRGGVRQWGALALAAMWPESAEALERALLDDDDAVRWAVGRHLIRLPGPGDGGLIQADSGFLGPTANPRLAQRFAGLMEHQEQEVRFRAVRALHHLGADARLAVAPLRELIDRERWRVPPGGDERTRAKILTEAVNTLGDTGTAGEVAIGALTNLAEFSSESVRIVAARALGKLTAQPDLAVPLLTRLLRDPSREVKITAAASLGSYGAKARSAVAAMVNVLDETRNILSRSEVIGAIEKIDPAVGGRLRELERHP